MGAWRLLVLVPKSKNKEWQINALSTKFKVNCLGPEVMGSNSLVSNPWQGCSGPCPTLVNASLAVAESRSPEALAFPAPKSGWTGLLVTALPFLLHQLLLWLRLLPFQGKPLLTPQTPVPHAATRWRAGASHMDPEELLPKA